MAALGLVVVGCEAPIDPLPEVAITVDGHPLHVELAMTPAARTQGLKGRTVLAPGAGMLFVLDAPESVCVWMKDTSLALSAAFVDEDGVILAVRALEPGSRRRHCAPAPVRYVLEVPRGWLAARRIGAGSRLDAPGLATAWAAP